MAFHIKTLKSTDYRIHVKFTMCATRKRALVYVQSRSVTAKLLQQFVLLSVSIIVKQVNVYVDLLVFTRIAGTS